MSPIGQVSADGQFRWDGTQWVPIAPGSREATSWTRPMRLASAAVFAVGAVLSVVLTVAFVNHDTMLRALKAQGTQIPQGTSIDSIVSISLGFAIGVVVFLAILELVAAAGSFLGWRWMFWAALICSASAGSERSPRSDHWPSPTHRLFQWVPLR